ncbi:MAG: acetyl-CoA carboxylase carboxyl transferase subunit alpha [Firmicutes bacterium]|nr:acetyl-CoA carboxylase carboxyl transferase subunit alpha [Bacillota bacterium]
MAKAYDNVKIARKVSRPTALDYIDHIFDGFVELHGDRNFRDDKAIVGGIAWLENRPVTVIGIQKGKTMEENIERNFGSPHPEGYRKALRLMKQAEKFGRPIINLINTSGAYCGVGAEERGQGEAIAKNLMEMAELKVPSISIVIGEGGSGGALALAVTDRVWMLENSVYAILSPEGFASILWKDASRAKEAADVMKLTANDLLELGIIEKVIKEAKGGCQNDFGFTANLLKSKLVTELDTLCSKSVETLLEERYQRFRKFGEFSE